MFTPRNSWALIVVAVLVAYWPALQGGMRLDDVFYMTPPPLRSWNGLLTIWTQLRATPQYFPATFTAFWLENRLWGDSTFGAHLVNLLLHLTVSTVVWRLLRHLRVPGALLAAAIFALHPVNVESVAWISELKNTLSTLCYLLALWCYLEFDVTRKRSWYAGAFSLFLLGVLAKSVVATFPVGILLILWWQRGRLDLRKDLLPTLPFWVIGIALGIVTAWIESHLQGAHGSQFALSALQRVLLAGRALWFYAANLLWPANLMLFYPRWTLDPGQWWQWLFPLSVVLVVSLLWFRCRHDRSGVVAVLFFIVTLAPVLGFVNIALFLFTYVANHHQYLADLGLIVIASAAAITWLDRARAKLRMIGLGVTVVALAVFGGLTHAQSELYGADDTALYRDNVQRNPGAWRAEENWAMVLLAQGDSAEALTHFLVVVSKYPDLADAQLATAGLLYGQGRFTESIAHFQKTLAMTPEDPKVHFNFAAALVSLGDTAHATAEFEEAGRLGAASLEMQDRLTSVFTMIGDTAGAARAGMRARMLRSGMP